MVNIRIESSRRVNGENERVDIFIPVANLEIAIKAVSDLALAIGASIIARGYHSYIYTDPYDDSRQFIISSPDSRIF